MKKLYSNITAININGKPSDLYDLVKKIDVRMETLSNATLAMRNILYKHLDSSAGKQYELALKTVFELSKELYSAATEINDLQKQVCKFVEKINEYDLRGRDSISPRKLNLKPIKIDTTVSRVQYDKAGMSVVLKYLKGYLEYITTTMRAIKLDKEMAGKIWRDRQYNDFSNEIDKLILYVNKSVRALNDYSISLDNHMRKLDS